MPKPKTYKNPVVTLQQKRRQTIANKKHSEIYDYQWQKLQAYKLKQDPMCEVCNIHLAEQVHHVIKVRDNPALRLVYSNLQSICKECHKQIE